MTYEREADELIQLIFSEASRPERVKLTASFLRELVAASQSGCAGYEADPDGPTLVLKDPVASGAAVLADATEEEVDGFLGAVREGHGQLYGDLPRDLFPPPAPGPSAYCGACARSGVGVCDDWPDCPAGRVR